MDTESSIQTLRTFEQYQAERENAFPSVPAVVWFARRHRDALNRAGALVRVNGRIRIAPDRFDAVVLEVGLQQLEPAAA